MKNKNLFSFGIIIFLLFLTLPVSAAVLDDSERRLLYTKLREECYETAQIHYNDASMGAVITEQSDFNTLTAEEIRQSKDDNKKWAQINIDILNCYKKNLAGYPELISKVDKKMVEAQQDLAAIEKYDYRFLLMPNKPATSVVTIPANSTADFRLRTFCLDSGRGRPTTREEFYLSGPVSELGRKNTCDILLRATNGNNLGEIQEALWSEQVFPPEKTEEEIKAEKIAKIVAYAMSIGGPIILLATLIIGFFIKTESRRLKIVLKTAWGLSIAALLAVTAIGFWKLHSLELGFFKKKTTPVVRTARNKFLPITTPSGKKSLVDAARSREVIVKAFSTGAIEETDVEITNRTAKDLELDASCIYFIPKITGRDEAFSATDWKDVFFAPVLAYGFGSQRLGSGGSLGGGPPSPGGPLGPGDLLSGSGGSGDGDSPGGGQEDGNGGNEGDGEGEGGDEGDSGEGDEGEGDDGDEGDEGDDGDKEESNGDKDDGKDSEDEEDTEKKLDELKKKTAEDLKESLDKFKNNPTEENLRDVIEKMSDCQLVGCGADEGALDEMADAWQDKLDQETEAYKNNPTGEARDELMRDSEICQMLGCDASGALAAMGLAN